MFEPYICIF